jgi:hypothetical protein
MRMIRRLRSPRRSEDLLLSSLPIKYFHSFVIYFMPLKPLMAISVWFSLKWINTFGPFHLPCDLIYGLSFHEQFCFNWAGHFHGTTYISFPEKFSLLSCTHVQISPIQSTMACYHPVRWNIPRHLYLLALWLGFKTSSIWLVIFPLITSWAHNPGRC